MVYWVFFGIFLIGGGPIMQMSFEITPYLHNILDDISLLGAILASALIYKAYRQTRATLLAIVAMAFAATSFLEAVHVMAGREHLAAMLGANVETLMPWSWHATRVMLAITLIAAMVHSRKDNFGTPDTVKSKRFPSARIMGSFLLFTVPIGIYVLATADLRPIYYAAAGMIRVPEMVSGSLFLVALLMSIRLGNWRTDSYGHWLNIAILASVVGQLFLMAFSSQFFDASFVGGHVMKLATYAIVCFGFLQPHQAAASSIEAEAMKPRGLGLGAKVGLLCGFIGFICVMPIAYKSSQNLHKIAVENGIDRLSVAATNAVDSFERQRDLVDADVSYLAASKVVSAMIRAEQNNGYDADSGMEMSRLKMGLQTMSGNLIQSDAAYVGFSFFSANSEGSIVSAYRDGVDVEAMNASEKALVERALVETGSALLNAKSIRSEVFTIRDAETGVLIAVEGAALPVISRRTGGVSAVLVVHTDIAEALNGVSALDVDTSLYAINTKGQFVIHPDASKIMNPEGEGVSYAEFFPAMADTQNDAFFKGFEYIPSKDVALLVGVNRAISLKTSGEPLRFAFSADREVMSARASEIGFELQQIAQINLLVAVAIGWFFARRFAKPVQQLSTAAVEFGRTGEAVELPAPGRDEIGALNKSLSEMMSEVSSQRDRLGLLAAAVESSINSTLITSNTGEVIYVNPHYERYSGVNADSIMGINVRDLPEFKANLHILTEAPAKVANEYVWSGEMQYRRADRRVHDEAVTVSPIRDSEGNMVNHSVVIEDITARKEMERNVEAKGAELQRSNRDLEQFAYVASHDLKAPLRAIEVLVGWLKDDLEEFDEGDVQENLDLLGRRTSRLGRLLDDLLAYSRAGRKVGDVRTIDTGELVSDVGILLSPPEGFTIEVADDLPTITSHHAPLETVFRNLMGNAIKHSPVPEEGRIVVTAEDRGDRVEFAVQDNGTGIDPQYADKVFKMFQTLQARDEKEGSGMGLAIVQRIIDWQGGKIWFHEGPDGKGAVFRFTWSKRPAHMPDVEDMEGDEESLSNTQILRAQALEDAGIDKQQDDTPKEAVG